MSDGLAVQAALADELQLAQPPITWHAARDSMAEAVSFLGLVTGSLAKIATDIMLMMQTEVAEAFEPFVAGRGSSSTMPQKRNPISCEMIVALAKTVRQHAGLMLDAMAADHERATGPWHLEWIALPESFIATAGALHQSRFMLEGLIVVPDRMRKNLDLTGGLIVAEAVMMALAPHTGRGAAHDLVYAACRSALEEGTPLLEQLEKRAEITVAPRCRGPRHALSTPPTIWASHRRWSIACWPRADSTLCVFVVLSALARRRIVHTHEIKPGGRGDHPAGGAVSCFQRSLEIVRHPLTLTDMLQAADDRAHLMMQERASRSCNANFISV